MKDGVKKQKIGKIRQLRIQLGEIVERTHCAKSIIKGLARHHRERNAMLANAEEEVQRVLALMT